MKPIISIDKLSKSYKLRHEGQTHYKSLREEIFNLPKMLLQGARSQEEFWALRNVSFDVMPGERVGIIGRNGAGKSTLLKLLSRITLPTHGRIAIRGRLASLLEVGTGFHPELTGRENIFLNGAVLGMPRHEIQQKFNAIVDFSGVERFLDTPVKRYSSGMYVRLAFAVAAHLEPDILVIDEVLAVGDAEFQKRCLGKMGELSSSGRTILFVTHNLEAMQTLCSRSIVLESGAVLFDGIPGDARAVYVSRVEESGYSLECNAGRGGSGGVAIDSVFVDPDCCKNGKVVSGERLRMLMCASVGSEYHASSDMVVAFGVDTVDAQRVYTVLSSWESFDVKIVDGKIAVACEIDPLPLVAGRYLVSVAVIFRGDTLESVRHCAYFDVLPRAREVHVERSHEWGVLDIPCSFINIGAKPETGGDL